MSQQQGLMAGKRGLIMGLANQNSIAWGIAQSLHREGAELAFSYVGEAMAKRVKPLAQSIGAELLFDCDVASDDALDAGFAKVAEAWDRLDFVVHAIGFSDKNELRGPYLTERDSRQCHFSGGNPYASGKRHRRVPLYAKVERASLAFTPKRVDRRGGRRRALPALRSQPRRYRRAALRRCRGKSYGNAAA